MPESNPTKPQGAAANPRARFIHALLRQLRKSHDQLRTDWWIPLLAVALGVFAAAIWNIRQPVAYVSEARMMVSGRISMPEGAVYSEELSNFFGTQTELMRSGEVLRLAEERLASTEPEIPRAKVKLAVEHIMETAIFKLTVTGESPAYSQKFLDAVMEEYMAAKKQMRSETSETTVAAITEELARLEKEIRAGEDELLEFQKENNVGFLEEQGNSAANYVVTLNRKLADLKTEYQLLESLDGDQALDSGQKQKLHALVENDGDAAAGSPAVAEASPASPVPGTGGQVLAALPVNGGKEASDEVSNVVNGSGGAEADYASPRQALKLLEAERDEFARVLRPRHPVMIDLNRKVALLGASVGQGSDEFKSHRELIRLEIANLEKTVKEWNARAVDLGERTARYNRMKDKLDRAKEVYQRQILNLRNVDVNKNVDQDVVSVLERASTPVRVMTGLWSSLVIGAGMGLLVGATALYLLGEIDDRVGSSAELQKQFPEHILAQIPRVALTGKEREGDCVPALTEKDERHAFAESLRSLRSSLVFLPIKGALPKSLLITSAVPNEGKSTIAANLAITMAFAYSKVLLIDGDLRRGALHKVFDLPNDRGFAEALRENETAGWKDAVQPTRVAGLSLLPRGKLLHHSSEHFLRSSTDRLLSEAYRLYDYVIIDTPPVLVADDTLSLAPKIDATIFVIRLGSSSARTSRRAIKLLRDRQANILGITCNDVKVSDEDYNYYYSSHPEYYGSTSEANA